MVRLFLQKVVRFVVNKAFIGVITLLFASSSLSLAQQSNTELTLRLTESFSTIFLTDSFTNTNNLSVGFIHLPSYQSAIQNTTSLEGKTKFGISNLITDAWGYTEQGFEMSLNGTSTPYAVENSLDTSSDLLLSTSYFQSLDSLTGTSLFDTLGLSGYTEISLQARFNPAYLTGAETNTLFSAQGYLGYRQSFDTQLPIGTNNILIERISIEPKVEAIYDTELNFGANLSIFADTNLFDSSNLSLGLEGGYTNGFWYNFTINSPIKF